MIEGGDADDTTQEESFGRTGEMSAPLRSGCLVSKMLSPVKAFVCVQKQTFGQTAVNGKFQDFHFDISPQ